MKMTEFRSQQPLNDDDFKTIRRNVMTTITARTERRFFPIMIRFALAAAVIIAIGVALVPRRTTTPAAITTMQPAAVIPAAPAPIAVAPVAVAQVSRPVTHRPRHRRTTTPHIELAHQNIRVEFRTSDPDVRIIWIASQTPNTTGGKS